MNSKPTYTRSQAEAAVEIYTRLDELIAQVEELNGKRHGLSGPAKGKVTRQITPLQAKIDELADEATNRGIPRPIDAATAVEGVDKCLQSLIDDYEETIAAFADAVAKDPAYGLQKAEEAVKAQLMRNLAERVLKIEDFWEKLEALIILQDSIPMEYLRRHTRTLHSSANEVVNMVRGWKVEAHAAMLDHSDFFFIHGTAVWYSKRVAVWEALNN
jgi:hypothetical protein